MKLDHPRHRGTDQDTETGRLARAGRHRGTPGWTARALMVGAGLVAAALLVVLLDDGATKGLVPRRPDPVALRPDAAVAVRLDTTVEIPVAASGALELWIPVPSSDESQDVDLRTLEVDLGSVSTPWELTTDELGNHFVHLYAAPAAPPFALRTSVLVRRNSRGYLGTESLEAVIAATRASRDATISYPYSGSVEAALASVEQADSVEDLVGTVLDRLLSTVAGAGTGLRQAALLNEVLRRNGQYIKVGAYGRGSSTWFCLTGQGNCTDFHFTYLDIAERVELPARLRIGVPLSPDPQQPVPARGDIPGYHCWVYLDGDLGFAIDPSWEARLSAPTGTYFGRPLNDRIKLTEGTDLSLSPPIQGEPLRYLFEAYAESEGVPIERVYGAAEPSSHDVPYIRTMYAFTRIN